MAVLAFKVEADYEEVAKLREEIEKLKATLKGMNASLNPTGFAEANDKLKQMSERFAAATDDAKVTGASIVDQSDLINEALSKVAAGVAGAFAVDKVKDFIMQIVNVRGQFQQLEVSFKTMLGSADKASALMNQLVHTAAITPFDLQGVANGAKQLLAYGTAAEEVNDTLVKLGDIAAGLSLPLGDLVYLYGTTVAQGRMFTQDLRQFMGRGIPMAKELANVMGVAEDEIAGLVTSGKVTSDVFKRAIDSMAAVGGQFGGLMEEQSKTITGQISNIEDAIDTMFNDIGKKSEGVINVALSGVSYLVEHYEEVGRQVIGLVSAYGAYKAALITLTAVQRVNMAVVRQAALEKQLAAAQGIALSNAEALAAARTKLLAVAQQGLSKAIKAVTASLASNPYTLAAVAIAALTVAVYEWATAETEAGKTTKATNEALEAQKKAVDDFRQKAQTLIGTATDEAKSTYERIEAYEALKALMPELTSQYKDLDELTKALKEDGAKPKLTDAGELDMLRKDAEKWKGYLEDMQTVGKSLNTDWKVIFSRLKGRGFSDDDANALIERLKKVRQELIDSGNDITHWYNSEANELNRAYSLVAGKAAATAQAFEEASDRMKAASLADRQKEEQEQFDNTYDSIDKCQSAIKRYTTELEELKKQTKGNAFTVVADIVTKESPRNWLQALKDRMNEITNANPLVIPIQLEASGLESLIGRLRNRLTGLFDNNLGKAYADAEKAWKSARDEVSRMEKNRSNYSTDAYSKAKEQLAEAKKAFEALGGETSTKKNTSSKDTETAEQRRIRLEKAHQQTLEIIASNAKEEQRREEDLQYEINRTKIEAMEDGFAKEQALRDLEHKKSIRDLERERDDMVDAVKKAAKAEFDAKESEKKEKDKKYAVKNFNWETDATDAQKAQVATVTGLFDSRITVKREANDKEDADASKMYLDKYKGYLEQRRDITERYAKDEADLRAKYKAQGKGGSEDESAAVDELNRERDEMLKNLDEEVAMRQEDFEIWANTLADLSLKQLDKMIAEAESELEKVKGNPNASATDVAKANATVTKLSETRKKKSVDDGVNAKKNTPQKRTLKQWQKLQEVLTDTNQSLQEMGENLGGTMGKIISTTADFATSVMSMVNGIVTLTTASADGVKTTAETSSKAIQTVEKASVILAIISAALQIVTQIMSLFGANYDKYNKEKDAVQALSDVWDDLIAKKKEYINTSYADEARRNSKEAIKLLEDEARAYRNLGKVRLKSGASVGSHTIGTRLRKSLTATDIRKIEEAAKKSGFYEGNVIYGRMEGLFNLSAEQLRTLKETAVEFWAKLDEDVRDYLEKIIEADEQANEIQESLKESLTGISFDSMKSDFIDNLMDMEYSARDFANDVNEMFATALVTQMVEKQFKDRLRKVYDDMADAIGKEDEQERLEALKAELASIRNAAAEERDAIFEITGYDKTSQQDADSGGFEAMTQDTAEELSGRFTALQVVAQNQYARVNEIAGSVSGMLAIARDSYAVHTDARSILAESLVELRTISENTAASKKMLPVLERIETRLKTI